MKNVSGELSVATIFSDKKSALEITKALRANSSLPVYYNNILAYSDEVNSFDILICDVRDISFKNNHLKEVLSKKSDVALVLYYQEEFFPLVKMAKMLKPKFHINGSFNVPDQINSIVNTLLENKRLAVEKEQLQKVIDKYKKDERMAKLNPTTVHFPYATSFIEIMKQYQSLPLINKVATFIDNLSVVKSFSLMHKNSINGQLISPQIEQTKFFPLNSLNLRAKGEITPFDERIVLKMAADIYGPNLVFVPIKNSSGYSEILLFIEVTESRYFTNYPWNEISDLLTSVQIAEEVSSQHELSVHSGFNFLSRIENLGSRGNESTKAFEVDLTELFFKIRTIQNNQFDWEGFINELSVALGRLPAKSNELYFVSLDRIALVAEAPATSYLDHLKNILSKFNYFQFLKYQVPTFENEILIGVEEIPLGANGYLHRTKTNSIDAHSFRSPTLSN